MHRSPSAAGCSEPPDGALPAMGVARIDDFGALDAASARLEARDRTRLATIVSEKRRRELLAGRRLLRELATHLGLRVAFDGAETGAGIEVGGGAPPGARLSASVTHSGPWVACAIGAGGGIGVDLEVVAERDFVALAEAAFPDSVASIAALSGEDRKLMFYRRWTQHEAAIKRAADGARRASWVLPGAWVLSLEWSAGTGSVPGPLLWDERAREFRSLDLQRLDRPDDERGECRE